MSIFTPSVSGGGFDWGGFANAASGLAMNIMSQKQQNKMLKRLTKLGGAGMGSALSFAGNPAALGFAGVPAAAGAASTGLGSVLQSILGGAAAGTAVGGLGGLGFNLPGGLEEVGSGTGVFGLDMFEPGRSSQRARRLLMANNPTTGNPTFWRHVGSPVLFSGDLALNKRIQKIAPAGGAGAARPFGSGGGKRCRTRTRKSSASAVGARAALTRSTRSKTRTKRASSKGAGAKVSFRTKSGKLVSFRARS